MRYLLTICLLLSITYLPGCMTIIREEGVPPSTTERPAKGARVIGYRQVPIYAAEEPNQPD